MLQHYKNTKQLVLAELTAPGYAETPTGVIHIIFEFLYENVLCEPLFMEIVPPHPCLTNRNLQKKAFQLLSYIVVDEILTHLVLNTNTIDIFMKYLQNQMKTKISSENKCYIFHTLSNMCYVSTSVTQALIQHGIVDYFIRSILDQKVRLEFKTHCILCLCNLVSHTNDRQKCFLLEVAQIVSAFGEYLQMFPPTAAAQEKTVFAVLESMNSLLTVINKLYITKIHCIEKFITSLMAINFTEDKYEKLKDKILEFNFFKCF